MTGEGGPGEGGPGEGGPPEGGRRHPRPRPGAARGEGLAAVLEVARPPGFSLALPLDIPPGRTVALLGPNGAGKSTAVACLAGLVPLDGGRIELGGVVLDEPAADVFVPPEERRVGVVFQERLLFPHLDVRENVAFGLRARGMPGRDARRRAEEWLERVGLSGFGARRPGSLSGGQAQRVALARALAPEPALLLLDEPFSALDVASRAELRRLLAEHLEAFPGPRLLITHDPAEAFQLADEIHVVEGGRVTQVGSPAEIRLRPRTPWAAELAGTNLLTGVARGGRVPVGEGVTLTVADPEAEGPVRVSIPPGAVSIHLRRPEGSPRNRWETVVERVEDQGGRVRVLTGPPLPLVVVVTEAARRELDLRPGGRVWLSVKAMEVAVERDPGE